MFICRLPRGSPTTYTKCTTWWIPLWNRGPLPPMVHAQKAREATQHFFATVGLFSGKSHSVWVFLCPCLYTSFLHLNKNRSTSCTGYTLWQWRLQSNTLWAGFPSRDILLGGGCFWFWGPACRSRQSEAPSDRPDRAVKRGEKEGKERRSAAIVTYRVWLSLSITAVFVSFHHSH